MAKDRGLTVTIENVIKGVQQNSFRSNYPPLSPELEEAPLSYDELDFWELRLASLLLLGFNFPIEDNSDKEAAYAADREFLLALNRDVGATLEAYHRTVVTTGDGKLEIRENELGDNQSENTFNKDMRCLESGDENFSFPNRGFQIALLEGGIFFVSTSTAKEWLFQFVIAQGSNRSIVSMEKLSFPELYAELLSEIQKDGLKIETVAQASEALRKALNQETPRQWKSVRAKMIAEIVITKGHFTPDDNKDKRRSLGRAMELLNKNR